MNCSVGVGAESAPPHFPPTEMTSLLCRKQADYGHGNINAFGLRGIIIRMNDKVQRIMNLHHTACTPNHECLTDSVNDLAIYGTIMQVLRQGNWPGADERWAL